MVGNRKGSRMGMICQQWRRGEPSFSLMHHMHCLNAQNPFQQVLFQTLPIKGILTLKWTPATPTFFSVLSIFWPAKKKNKGEGIETLHYRLIGLMFLRSITCNSSCFWLPQASVLMFFITNYTYLLLWWAQRARTGLCYSHLWPSTGFWVKRWMHAHAKMTR